MSKDVLKSLELLEEYHAELFRSNDLELKLSIEKLIEVFKNNLFSALCDIKEFYDNILLNETLPISKKVYETKRFADCWNQKRQPIKLATTSRPLLLNNSLEKNRYSCAPTITTTHQTIGTPTQRPIISTCLQNKFLQTPKKNHIIDEFNREWEVEEVLLDASNIGLGFSISGGRDRDPEPDYYIRVTDISFGGAVAIDKRILIGDVILRVNDVDCVNVNHQVAVSALQKAGPFVCLLVKRLKPQRSLSQSHLNEVYQQQQQLFAQEQQRAYNGTVGRSKSLHQLPQNNQQFSPRQTVMSSRISNHSANVPIQTLSDLTKTPRTVTLIKTESGLGFNIVGGEDNEPIYVSHILPGGVADLNGKIKKGDVLLRVNDTDLSNATHAQAAFALKSIILNTYVRLLVHYRPREYHLFEDKIIRLQEDLIQKKQLQQQKTQQSYSYQ